MTPSLFVVSSLLVAGLVWWSVNALPDPLRQQFHTLVTIFLGIFIEAVPFLIAGSLVSGLIAEFLHHDRLLALLPRQPVWAALVGVVMGFAFPVCECGVVPVTRRLYAKGLPLPVGVAFLLAAPVVNPVVLGSTYAAFGWGPVLIGRFVGTLLIAFVVGLIFTWMTPAQMLRPIRVAGDQIRLLALAGGGWGDASGAEETEVEEGATFAQEDGRWWRAFAIAGDEFLDMVRYLILGSLLAATMQTFVPQATLMALGRGPVLSVLVLMLLAFVLSICSTVDSFVALSFVNSFTTGPIVSFLVFGPMVDIKSALMFLGVFRRRVVLLLIALPFFLTLVLGVVWTSF